MVAGFGPKIVITDSIPKRVGDDAMKDTTLRYFRGKTLSDIGDFIENGSIRLQGFETIMIHVGTNDVSNLMRHNSTVKAELRLYDFSFLKLMDYTDIVQGFIALVNIIRQYNRRAVIVFSGIIPRVVDHSRSDPIIRAVNKDIQSFCESHSSNMLFYPTYRWFVHAGQPVSTYYAKKDKLHLTDVGSARLRQAFQTIMSDTTLAAQVGVVKEKGAARKRGCRKRVNEWAVQGSPKRVRTATNLIQLT